MSADSDSMVEYFDYWVERIKGLGCRYLQLMQDKEQMARSLAEKAGLDMASFPTLPPFPFTRPEEDGEMEEAQGEETNSVGVGTQTMSVSYPKPLERIDDHLSSRLDRLAVYCDDCADALHQMLRFLAEHMGLEVASFARPLNRHPWLVQEVEEEGAESSVED